MFGFFDDPFFTNDSHRLLNYLVNDYNMDVDDDNETTKKQIAKCNNNNCSDIFTWKPRSDIHETDTSFVIDAELPGVPKEGITIQVKDDILTISGKKETKKEWDDIQMNEQNKEESKKEESKKEESKKEEKEQTKEEKKKPICHYMERSYGSFQRSYALPEHVDPATIKAACKDGILTITIPKVKKQEPQVHAITIQ